MKEPPRKIKPVVLPGKPQPPHPQDHPQGAQPPLDRLPKKLGLLQIRELHSLSTFRIAEASGVSSDIVYYMLVRVPVRRRDAMRVIAGVNRLTGKSYTLEEMDVALVERKG